MKEYVSYELMTEIGVDAPYYGYADLSVNGQKWGLYLAVELYNDSYEERVYGDTSGMLYNVKSMEANQAQKGNMGGRQGGGSGSSGGSLQYTDDKTDSYSAIFGNVVGKGTEQDYERVIEALEALAKGEDLADYFDIDQILRYLAAHTVVVNLDSYSSSMAQNYYLYERDGKITVLPWDYNLAWGGFQSGSASSVVNFPIDTPVSGVEMSDRPLIETLFQNPEYLQRYHSYLQELVDSYFTDGKFEEKVNELNQLITDYVRQDPTAFCTYEEYEKAVSAFITLGELRAESIQGQLDQTIPSTTEGQQANQELLIDAGNLNLSELGTMMGGKGGAREDMGIPGQSKKIEQLDGSAFMEQMGAIGTSGGTDSSILLTLGVSTLVLIVSILAAARWKRCY